MKENTFFGICFEEKNLYWVNQTFLKFLCFSFLPKYDAATTFIAEIRNLSFFTFSFNKTSSSKSNKLKQVPIHDRKRIKKTQNICLVSRQTFFKSNNVIAIELESFKLKYFVTMKGKEQLT